MNKERRTSSALCSPNCGRFHLEDEPRLQLEHPRRVDVCERRDGVSVCAYRVSGREQTEGGGRCCEITVGRNTATEEVSMIEDVEALQSQQKSRAFCQLDAILDEDGHVRGRGAAERRLLNDHAVDYRPVVVRAVTIVVNAGRGIKRTRGRELCQRAGREVPRELVGERDDRAMTLIGHAQSALLLAEPRDNALVRVDAVAVRLGGVGRLGQRVADLGIHTPVAAVSEIHL